MTDYYLEPIPPRFRGHALEWLESGDVKGFLFAADNTDGIELVFRNYLELQKRGLLEVAVLEAMTGTRSNNRHWIPELRFLLQQCNRDALRRAGDPLPSPGPFTLYRGVWGYGRNRHPRGFSWTSSLDKAKWFARRFPGIKNPTVLQITVPGEDILAYVNDRKEEEFIVWLPREAKVRILLKRADLVPGESVPIVK